MSPNPGVCELPALGHQGPEPHSWKTAWGTPWGDSRSPPLPSPSPTSRVWQGGAAPIL